MGWDIQFQAREGLRRVEGRREEPGAISAACATPLPPAAPTRVLTNALRGAVPAMLGARSTRADRRLAPRREIPLMLKWLQGKRRGVGTNASRSERRGWFIEQSPGRLRHVLLPLFSDSWRVGESQPAGFLPPRWKSAVLLRAPTARWVSRSWGRRVGASLASGTRRG